MKRILTLGILTISFNLYSQTIPIETSSSNSLKNEFGYRSAKWFSDNFLKLNHNQIKSTYNKVVILKGNKLIDTLNLKDAIVTNYGSRLNLYKITDAHQRQMDSVVCQKSAKCSSNLTRALFLLNYDFKHLEFTKITKAKDTLIFTTNLRTESWITKVLFDKNGWPLFEVKFDTPSNGKPFLRYDTKFDYSNKKQILKYTNYYNTRNKEKEIEELYNKEGLIIQQKTIRKDIIVSSTYTYNKANDLVLLNHGITPTLSTEYRISYNDNFIEVLQKAVENGKSSEEDSFFNYELIK